MLLIAIVGVLFAIAFLAYWWGVLKLAKYGFRISTGTGIAILLFPPFTLSFALKLQQDGKELPLTAWLFGIVSSLLLVGVFFQPLKLVLTGQMENVVKESSVSTAIEKPADVAKKAE